MSNDTEPRPRRKHLWRWVAGFLLGFTWTMASVTPAMADYVISHSTKCNDNGFYYKVCTWSIGGTCMRSHVEWYQCQQYPGGPWYGGQQLPKIYLY